MVPAAAPGPETSPLRRFLTIRRILALVLLFPLLALFIGGLAVGVDSYQRAKRYEEAAAGTMADFEGYTRDDLEQLRAQRTRHALASVLLVPFAVMGLTGCLAEVTEAGWRRRALSRAGFTGLLCGGLQVVLLWKHTGNMWGLGIFVIVFALVFFAFARGAPRQHTTETLSTRGA